MQVKVNYWFSGERPNICQHCGKGFVQKTDLKRHETTHSNEKNFICIVDGCGKAFSTKKNLSAHKYVHRQSRPCKFSVVNSLVSFSCHLVLQTNVACVLRHLNFNDCAIITKWITSPILRSSSLVNFPDVEKDFH